jgi:hypothetical protein
MKPIFGGGGVGMQNINNINIQNHKMMKSLNEK